MINLLLDIIISSISSYKTSFIIFDFKIKHHIIYILLISLIISYYTLSIYNFFLVILLYYLNSFLYKYIKIDFILYLISYIILFNINISITSTIIFIISVLINYFNPYN